MKRKVNPMRAKDIQDINFLINKIQRQRWIKKNLTVTNLTAF
jgi:hypothetical protein